MGKSKVASALTGAGARALSLAAHEIRTPTSVVAGYLRMLRDSTPALTAAQRTLVEDAERSCSRIGALATEMSDLARLLQSPPDAAAVPSRISLDQMLIDLTGHVASVNRSVHIERPHADAKRQVVGDSTRLAGALADLVRAVSREHADAAAIVVRCQVESGPDGREAILRIGAEPDLAGLDETPAPFDDRRGGLGLALPIARCVVERCGGRIWSAPPSEAGGRIIGRGAIAVALPVTE